MSSLLFVFFSNPLSAHLSSAEIEKKILEKGKMGFISRLMLPFLGARFTHLHIVLGNRTVERVRAPGSHFCRGVFLPGTKQALFFREVLK